MDNILRPLAWRGADDRCLLLFTSRTVDQMVREGGSQAWVLNLQRARQCRYVVCAWNPRGEYAQPNVMVGHGEAFLVAPIESIEPAGPSEPAGRYIVRFTRFAQPPQRRVVWGGQRNPVAYTTLSALGLSLDALRFELPASKRSQVPPSSGQPEAHSRGRAVPLTIAAAKRGLALQYDVDPDAIEIVIRG